MSTERRLHDTFDDDAAAAALELRGAIKFVASYVSWLIHVTGPSDRPTVHGFLTHLAPMLSAARPASEAMRASLPGLALTARELGQFAALQEVPWEVLCKRMSEQLASMVDIADLWVED